MAYGKEQKDFSFLWNIDKIFAISQMKIDLIEEKKLEQGSIKS